MKLDGIFFSEHYWPRFNTLWAYRFYPEGALLFTYADPVGRFVLHTNAGPTICHPADVLGNKSKLPEFVRCFSRESMTQITYRSGLAAITQGHYVIDRTRVLFSHDYFQMETCQIKGRVRPDRLLLTLTGTSLPRTGEEKSITHDAQVFLPF